MITHNNFNGVLISIHHFNELLSYKITAKKVTNSIPIWKNLNAFIKNMRLTYKEKELC